LEGKRLGIVGLGRIGEKVARYGLAFGMQVAAFDPYRSDWPEGILRCSMLEDLLRCSDVLSLHVPLNGETYHMIGERELSLLPQGAVLVNTARGGVVDENALLAALSSRHLAGAAIDVIENELGVRNFQTTRLVGYARRHDNLLITPHLAGATVESMAATEVFMAKKLKSFLRHRSLERPTD
jgi:D-3-phosphoglycerate dehydrogenase